MTKEEVHNSFVIYGDCFDYDLNERVDLEFYLISSPDNLVININNYLICYKRKNLLKNALPFTQNNQVYYVVNDDILKNYIFDEQNFNYLKNRDYSLYKFEPIENTSMIQVFAYKRMEYFENF